jgi:hypothetical protein
LVAVLQEKGTHPCMAGKIIAAGNMIVAIYEIILFFISASSLIIL